MTTARRDLVDDEQALCYHLVSGYSRGAWLFGRHAGKDYSHRKDWVEERLLRLGSCFAVDVLSYAVMSNHLHIVVYYDPRRTSGGAMKR